MRRRAVRRRPRAGPLRARRTTLDPVTESTEAAVARRVPSITDERLRVLSRRQPVTVLPGTSLADCVRAIQRTGTGDSVFVCDPSGRLAGVLTERDIFARIVGGTVDLSQPVESLMTTEPQDARPRRDDPRRDRPDADRSLPERAAGRRRRASSSVSSASRTSSSTWPSRSPRSCSTCRRDPTSA